MKRIGIILAVMCLAFSLFSCSNTSQHISDISGVTDELPIAIIVLFSDEYEGSYEVTDKVFIRKIVDILNTRKYKFTNDTPSPGTNRSLTLKYSSGEEVTISTRAIKADNGYYTPSLRDDLDAILEEYGREINAISSK